MAQRILVLNGPNLNLLGTREPQLYGSVTLAQVDERLAVLGRELGVSVESAQSNHEGELVDRIQRAARESVEFIIINAGAYTHTSVALRDALAGVAIPFIEVHVSNVYKREPFRHHSYLSDQAVGVVAGLGTFGYEAALRYAVAY
ncbi:3-dehydroquinate dehydratase II [plant metagenome]|uniref:3-dehydroquinate dehydratase n=2 Tax=root TaxID=1 RepID=A0A1C3JXB9_9BURK|nr:type II 3-dehydroquinate dehydratase [Orrella dioscoreae]SBT23893.1 3-dehydroquinate dehydratase II [Orrella dioscoreae]SOE47175.1 3-dehydroquinate dehydratase II [Orrella dioscoreae]